MERMQQVIERLKLQYISDLEEDPVEVITNRIIKHFLYSDDDEKLSTSLDDIEYFDELIKKPSSFWEKMIEGLLQTPHVCITVKPDEELGNKFVEKENRRKARREKKYGKSGFGSFQEKLDEAMKKNSVDIPSELITKFNVPSVDGLQYIPITTIRNGVPVAADQDISQKVLTKINEKNSTSSSSSSSTPSSPIKSPRSSKKKSTSDTEPLLLDEKKHKIFFEFDHLQSAFVYFNIYIDTSCLDSELRKYLELYLELMFELPIKRNGKSWSHDKVVQVLTDITISYSNSIGYNSSTYFVPGYFSQLAVITVRCQTSKYEEVISMLKDILWNRKFTEKRIKIALKKMLKKAKKHKLSAEKCISAIVNATHFHSDSNLKQTNLYNQYAFLNDTLQVLDSNSDKVIDKLLNLADSLLRSENMSIQVCTDIINFPTSIKQPWLSFFPKQGLTQLSDDDDDQNKDDGNEDHDTDEKGGKKVKLPPPASKYLVDLENLKSKYILGLTSVESSYLSVTSPAPKRFDHRDIPAILVVIEYLTRMEGPLWKEIRGAGLSYGFDMYLSTERGLIYFELSEATHLLESYLAAKRVVESLNSKECKFSKEDLVVSKSSLLFSIISDEETLELTADHAYLNYISQKSTKSRIEAVMSVTRKDMEKVVKKYIAPMFDPESSNIIIATNTSKVKSLKKSFKKQATISLTRIEDVQKEFENITTTTKTTI
eukprot:TRINITY_DN2202_c0_g2_i3.p1 TRINITY_DN2202_c0_g2~~TRINITY_DN2202_c0_g2_i3.p1  ORF type:complete len:714 (+),score=176.41 TRINITY_DN2202_c0_g2_i3:1308-3449(+)